ncbi:hypothetical protein L3X38_018141 [Prunus dulcis]|uniref:Uncharacterized protein n=1 Tax=Prunus dulcis TaxID=3755 RepID=A0AAD4WA91_PRUDU|nr:hypothetical protein L3X38_018141 [Prunus dulcis]
MASFLIYSSFANGKPTSNALYSASLFEVGKPSVIGCPNTVPSRVTMTTPAPAPFWFDALSTHSCHMSLGWSGSAEVLSALGLSLFLLTSFSS